MIRKTFENTSTVKRIFMMTHLFSQRATSRFIGVLALALLGGAAVQAQEAPEAPGVPGAAPAPAAPGQGGGRRGQGGGRQQRQQPAVVAFKAVNPTPEQQTKFDALQTKMRDEMMALRGQGDARDKMQTMNAKFQDDIEALLTPEQKKTYTLELAKAQGNLLGQIESLELTKDELDKVRPLVRDTQRDLRGLQGDLTPEDRKTKTDTLLKDLKAKIRPLLTAEKQTKLDALELKTAPARGGRGGFGGGRQSAPAAPSAPAPAADPVR
jgi:hypothetical protein